MNISKPGSLPHVPVLFCYAGNLAGDVIVFESVSGKQMVCMSADRESTRYAVKACALTQDCRHLLAASGNGFVSRYEFVRVIKAVPAASAADTASVISGP